MAGLRRFTLERRLALTNELTGGVRAMSWANFCRQYAHLSEMERRLRWIALLYGEDLAARVGAYVGGRWGQS